MTKLKQIFDQSTDEQLPPAPHDRDLEWKREAERRGYGVVWSNIPADFSEIDLPIIDGYDTTKWGELEPVEMNTGDGVKWLYFLAGYVSGALMIGLLLALGGVI